MRIFTLTEKELRELAREAEPSITPTNEEAIVDLFVEKCLRTGGLADK